MYSLLVSLIIIISFQHKEFEEIEARLQRREPLCVPQRLSRRLPEVVADRSTDLEIDPYDDVADVQKKLRSHQVYLL